MKTIDGSFGEGGGQIVRTSLTLSAVLGVPFRMEGVRAGRDKPGLLNQHLAAARAVAKITGGELQGAKKGSTEFSFRPRDPRPGKYSREIGTAGSTTLVLQTVLPVLAAAEGPSTIMLCGGTHNPMAPPAEFISECFIPAARLLGLPASLELVRHGFYPKGGGALRAEVGPWQKGKPIEWLDQLDWGRPEVTVLVTNLPEHVAFREQEEVAKRLQIDPGSVKIEALPGEVGPGNAVMVRCRAGALTALVTSFGEPGKRAERVAQEAARNAKKFARSGAPVDPHLADQLLLPMALGPGGGFLTSEISEHTRTNAHVIEEFLGAHVIFDNIKPDLWKVSVPGYNSIPRGP